MDGRYIQGRAMAGTVNISPLLHVGLSPDFRHKWLNLHFKNGLVIILHLLYISSLQRVSILPFSFRWNGSLFNHSLPRLKTRGAEEWAQNMRIIGQYLIVQLLTYNTFTPATPNTGLM